MSSNRSQFLDESITHQEQKDRPAERQRKRRANLYDAVAGRVNAHGFIPATPYASKYRDTASSSSRALPPEEVLFRREGMPVRYEETDRYFAHESLPADQPLPSSELLESIHAYTADYYDQALGPNGRANQYSMNGKSLMFMGVLLEELAKESLGDTGDLALVEGDDLLTDEPTSELGRRMGRKRANSRRSSIHASSGEDLDSVVKRKKRSKIRRLTHRASATDIDTEPEGRLRLTDR